MAKQLVLRGNRVLSHGEDCFLCAGGAVICPETGRTFENATVVNHPGEIPSDIDEVGYEYHAGAFVPCAPFGKGGGNIAVVCNEDCKSIKDSGVSSANLSNVMNNGVTLSFLPSINLPNAVGTSSSFATGGGKIVVLGYNVGNEDYISSDGGETWKKVTLPFTHNNGAGLAYDETLDLFVAVQYPTSPTTTAKNAAYSKDGINWTATTLSTARKYYSLAAGNGMFVAGTSSGGYVEYSIDGINWTARSVTGSSTNANVVFDPGNNVFVAITASANLGLYSSDCVTWSNVGGTTTNSYSGLCIGDKKYIFFKYGGELYVRASSALGTSTAWTAKTIPGMSGGKYERVVFANGLFFALPSSTLTGAVAEMAISTDGLTWEVIKTPGIISEAVIYHGNKFVGFGSGGGVYDSYDGRNWLYRNEYRLRMANGDDVTDIVKNMLA